MRPSGPLVTESFRGRSLGWSLIESLRVVSCLGLESSVFESTGFSSFLGRSAGLGVCDSVSLGFSKDVLGFSSTGFSGVSGLSTTTLGSSIFGLSTTVLDSSGLGLDTSLGFIFSGLEDSWVFYGHIYTFIYKLYTW